MKKYKLFSAVKRCVPCKMLVTSLDQSFPKWQDHIEYIDADSMTIEQIKIAHTFGIMSLPAFTDEDTILFKGYRPEIVKSIIELCNQTIPA